MPQTKIEWTNYSINPVKGKCPVACPYCYAREMYDRFRWNPEIRFCPSVFNDLPKKPVKVFVGSTMELFLFDDWMEFILNRCQDFPQHTFLFLTKKPEKLPQWSPFPPNCQVGVTATNADMLFDAINYLDDVQASVRFLSLEPLLASANLVQLDVHLKEAVDWVIIGAQTKPYKPPKIEWVQEIVEACDKAGVAVFIKDNLTPLLTSNLNGKDVIGSHNLWAFKYFKLRQEMPK